MTEQQPLSKREQLEKFKEANKKARAEAMTYVDLSKGENIIVQVMIEKGITTVEFDGEKGKFKKINYKVLHLESGRELDLRLTSKQAMTLEDAIEKLMLREFDPIVKLTKVDDKGNLLIEGLLPKDIPKN